MEHDWFGYFTLFALIAGPLICVFIAIAFARITENLHKSIDALHDEVTRHIDDLHR